MPILLALTLMTAQAEMTVTNVVPEPVAPVTHHSRFNHFELGLLSGPNTPGAFLGLETRVRPIRYLSLGIAAGIGPATTNPTIELFPGPSVDEKHIGWTPWRWSASLMGHIPLMNRVRSSGASMDVELTPQVAVMRNPGANVYRTDYPLCPGDESSTCVVKTTGVRPAGYFANPSLGVTFYAGPSWRAFARAQVGYTFRLTHMDRPASVDFVETGKDPVGVSVGLTGGIALF